MLVCFVSSSFYIGLSEPSSSDVTSDDTVALVTFGECHDQLLHDFHMTSYPVMRISFLSPWVADARGRSNLIDIPVVIKPISVLDQLIKEHAFRKAILIHDDSTGTDFFATH